jgi:MFS transporter, DHA1 family, inner membrane transport protein
MNAEDADRASRNAALTLTLALPGDTVLYLLLPLHAATFGIILPEAGLLLAANRFVRVFGYHWVAKYYATRGPRAACLAATLGAILSTFGYAACSGVWPLLVARLVWGLAFAAMNIANQALPTSHMHDAPRRMGRARSIVAVGPMAALLVGGITAELWGPRVVFLVLGCIALSAPFFALQLPTTQEPVVQQRPSLAGPDTFSIWSFCMGFALDGLFVFGLSLLAVSGLGSSGVIAASVAMALRYASEILLSPSGGALAHRYGARRMLIGLSLATAAALAILGAPEPFLALAVLATVILRALLAPLPAPVIAEDFPGAARVPALARQAVWRDIGAAAGPLAGGFLFPVLPALVIYASAGALFAAASLSLAKWPHFDREARR